MGIFRAGVRVSRAHTPSPSSSSSDGEEPEVEKEEARKTIDEGHEVGFLEDASDIYQVGESTCQLPDDLFELSNLCDILSLRSWNERLSEKERQCLCAYLPDMGHQSFQETLKELFSEQNLYFGSPMAHLWQQLKGGFCNPKVVRSRQTLTTLQRREYYHDLRRYHNGMVNSLMEMRELWVSDPEANVEEKLCSWNAWKLSEAAHIKNVKDSEGGSKMDCISRPTGHVNDIAMRSEGLTLQGDNKEPVLHSGLETTALRVQNQVDAVQPERNSIGKMDLSSRNKALSEGSYLKRKYASQEDSEHRSKQSKHVQGNGKDSRMLIPRCDSDVNALETTVSESSADIHSKVYKKVFDKQVFSSSRRDLAQSHVTKLMRSVQLTFVPPLTPGFSFSTLHFISAVRASLFDDAMPDGVECLPFREIVARIEACPGDLRVLRVQLPLDCLVRGALKALGSASKVLAMDGFRPLVFYDKAMRYWTWVGPVSGRLCTFREADLQAMSEVWGVSAAILNELLDMFEKWLKNIERTLQQVWQVAQVPLPAFPVFPEQKERFRELRAQKSSTTILPSSYEMRDLFRKEERVRYSTLEIAFRYTTADGQKSAVAPLRKLGGKSKAKARDHFMLRSDRPSHITILCLVRDAAARLPQGIGTRADVCILLKDSQFIEDVSELQLSQVVSGALDRLHYERDPCVRYDQEKKLWLYLHGDREDEDFEEGGTTSTRSSRRSKRDSGLSAVSPAQGNGYNYDMSRAQVNGCNDDMSATVSPAQGDGYNDDMSEPEPDSDRFSGLDSARKSPSPEFVYEQYQNGATPTSGRGSTGAQMREEVLLHSMQPFCGTTMQGHPMGWEVYKAGKELSITH